MAVTAPPRSALYTIPGKWPGMVKPGNINLSARPVVRNADGSISTVLSTSFNDPRSGHEVLVPQVVGGKVVSPTAAWQNYLKTGQHLGAFDSVAAADAYSRALHQQQARFYGRG